MAGAADQWMSETTTPGSLTPEQVQQYGNRLNQPSFWADMINGRIDFGNTYGAPTYSDDLGTHDLSTPYNVNIVGGSTFIGGKYSAGSSYPGCITPGWLINHSFISTALNEAWDKTKKSGEENGLFMVYDAQANRVHVGVASQGVHVPDPSGGTMPALPDFGKDYLAFVHSLDVKVTFLTTAHTHPFSSDSPSAWDADAIYKFGGPGGKGIIIYGANQYSLYSFAGKVPYQESYMKDCIAGNAKEPSVHVRFRN